MLLKLLSVNHNSLGQCSRRLFGAVLGRMVPSYTVICAAGDYDINAAAETGYIVGFKSPVFISAVAAVYLAFQIKVQINCITCLLYTSDAADEL